MSNTKLDSNGLITPLISTETILLEGENLKDLLTNNNSGEIRITSAHALGDFYFSITSHMPDGVLPLNGSEVSRATYSDLYDYVLSIHNELSVSGKKFIVSEEEWQNISIENNGYVPYYSYGTTDGMFRLPRMSGYLKATGEIDEAGNYVAEGLPNITGGYSNSNRQESYSSNHDDVNYYGAFEKNESVNSTSTTANNYAGYGFTFDASRSNAIYGNSEHVTPETNTLFVGVWALTAFTQVGTANLSEIKEIISQCETILGDSLPLLSSRYDNRGLETSAWKLSDGSWLDGRIYTDAYNKLLQRITEGDSTCLEMKESELLSTSEFPENFLIDTEGVKFRLPLFVVNERTIIKEWREGTEWYRIYSNGYCEQGGQRAALSEDDSVILNFHLSFANTEYTFLESTQINAISSKARSTVCFAEMTTISIKLIQDTYADNGGIWTANGYIDPAFMPPREEWEIDFNYYFKVSHGVDEGRINIEEKLTEFEETAYTRLNEVVEEVSKDYVVHVDKQVGELYFSFDNYCPDGVIPLDGRLVSRATYADLWEWVQEKGLVKEDALITTNDENTVSIFNEDGSIRYCQWYGSGDGELTFRVPKINGYIKASGDNSLAGEYVAEGLPNITGEFSKRRDNNAGTLHTSGSFTYVNGTDTDSHYFGNNNTSYGHIVSFDASASNPIYGNSEHVTPETNTLFVGVWAITASKAAVFDLSTIEETLKSSESYLMNNVPLMSSRWDRDGLGNLGWVKADGSWVDGKTYTGAYNYCVEKLVSGHEDFIDGQVATITEANYDKFIVDRIGKRFRLPISNGQRQLIVAYKEGTQWYNIYSDGWIEQGGEFYNNTAINNNVDLLVPFRDTSYTVDKIMGVDGMYTATATVENFATWNYTTSSFTARTYSSAGLNRFRWFAKGYGEVLSVSSPLRTLHLYFKLAHEFYAPAQAELQEKIDLIDNLIVKTDINLPTLSSRWDSDFAENIGWVKSEGQWLNGNVYRDAYDLMVSRIGVNDKFIEATEGTELTDENADKFLIDTTAVKFRLPLINGESVLVYSYKDSTSYCKLYSDGYLEQSGVVTGLNNWIKVAVNLHKSYKDTTYSISISGISYTSTTYNSVGTLQSKTTNSFEHIFYNTINIDPSWLTTGYANLPAVSEYNCGNYLFFKLADEVPSTVVNTEQVVADLKQECDDFKTALEEKFNSGAFVTETWRSEDGNNWYRKWSDGWIEQGGKSKTSEVNTFPIPFTKIPTFTHGEYNSGGNNMYAVGYCNLTETGFSLYRYSGGALDMYWYACGY